MRCVAEVVNRSLKADCTDFKYRADVPAAFRYLVFYCTVSDSFLPGDTTYLCLD